MRLLGEFIFHNVGQGLFYSGTIKQHSRNKFDFIYDCGSENNNHLKCIINDYLYYLDEKNIDMLVISHFHEDHVNGLEYLLKNNKPTYVFLPYFTNIHRLYILAKNLSFAQNNNWYLKFLQNPTKFLIGNGIDDNKIFYIHPSEHNETDSFNIEPNDNFEIQINLNDVNFSENNVEMRNLGGNHKLDKGYIQVGYWMFKFFYLEKNLDNFKKCIKGIDIDKVDFSDRKVIENLKHCYKKIKGNFNDTSLVMLHKPLVKVNNCQFYNDDCLYMCEYYCGFLCNCLNCDVMSKYKISAQILTGDINFRNEKNYKEFKQHYKNYLNEVLIFQIPHHGAKLNWNKELLRDIKNCYFWIASASRNNKYNHPSFNIFLDVIENDKCFKFVNESICSKFMIKQRS